jgi:hypothetical protein
MQNKSRKDKKCKGFEGYGNHVADINLVKGKVKCFFCGKDLGKPWHENS